jgi:hypothetical protein
MIYKLPLQLFRICLIFEINRLILFKNSVHSAIMICIRYAYVTSWAKSEIFILQTTYISSKFLSDIKTKFLLPYPFKLNNYMFGLKKVLKYMKNGIYVILNALKI